MWPVAFIAWFTVYEKGARSGAKHAQCTPPAENVLPQGLHQRLCCPPVHGQQRQKCPGGISSGCCVPGTVSDVPDRAGAEAQPSGTVALLASPANCRNNHQSSTGSLVQKRGTPSQFQHCGPVGLKNWQKETSQFQLPPSQLDLA